MAEELEVDVLRWHVCLDDTMDFLGLPVNNAGDNESKAATGMLLLEPVTAVQSSPVPVCEIACQGVKLFSLEQIAPVTFPHIRIGHKA
ncbi:MAG: hypothetical protein V3U27_18080 [Candidatus Tectomicrobia bacterium]